MNKKIASIILAWHAVYVHLTESVEHARIVLDQSDKGTLLPDRVREMRGHLIGVRESIPELADLLEALTDEVTWPMKSEEASLMSMGDPPSPDPEAEAEAVPAEEPEPPAAATGDYDAEGATPVEADPIAREAEEAATAADEEAEAEADATGTP